MNQHDFKHWRFPRSSREAFTHSLHFGKSRLSRLHFLGRDPESSPIYVVVMWIAAIVLFMAVAGKLG